MGQPNLKPTAMPPPSRATYEQGPRLAGRHAGEWRVTDGNLTISRVAYKTNGGIVIYTITPSSPFGEESAKRAARGEKNIYGVVPQVFMASDEAAAAAFIQGIAAKGVGAATCSSSQGILLMIPEMYNSAGQLLPCSFYIGARDLSRHSLTIFAGHSDVYAVRDTGLVILFAKDAQELQDLGAIAERLKWEVSLPVTVSYDGFLTTHKQTQTYELPDEFFWEFMPHQKMLAHKARALDPAHPTVWGTNENPDGYMQAGLAQRPHSLAVEQVLPALMKEFGELTGRPYEPYEYFGHPQATDLVVAAGSSISTLRATIRFLLRQDPDRRVGVINVRAFRPFLARHFIESLPETVERIAVLDRSMTHTAQDEPLCADVRTAVLKAAQGFEGVPKRDRLPIVSGGIYGLAGKDFHPGSVLEVLAHLQAIKGGRPWTNFTVGVVDDVMHSSLPPQPPLNIFDSGTVRQARIVAYGSDGTVSMVKAVANVYAEQPNAKYSGQGLFIGSHAEYDSKKAGGVTVSHLRVSTEPFEECFDVYTPDYVAVHHPSLLLKRKRILRGVVRGGTLVINTSESAETLFSSLPTEMQEDILRQRLEVYAIDAFKIAADHGLGNKISTVMQRVLLDRFGMISGEAADGVMEAGIKYAFGGKGEVVVEQNIKAFKLAVAALTRVSVPKDARDEVQAMAKSLPSLASRRGAVALGENPVPPADEDGFRQTVQGPGLSGLGAEVPVSAYYKYARGGARPVNTWKGLHRSFATYLPTYSPVHCNECGECVFTCPTGGALDQGILTRAQAAAMAREIPLARVFRGIDGFSAETDSAMFNTVLIERADAYGLAVDPNLCTGCGVCEAVCDKGAIKLEPVSPDYYRWLEGRREILDRAREAGNEAALRVDFKQSRHSQAEMASLPSYVGTSGACAGCYEPQYVSKFLQLYPDTVIANATGCSSIWGAQAYETPYSSDEFGYGAAWVNALFENNAAVGGGMALGVAAERDQMNMSAAFVLKRLKEEPGLAANDAVGELVGHLLAMHEHSRRENTSVVDRVEKLELIAELQESADKVAALEQVKRDLKLRTHLGLLRATASNFIDKTTLIVGGDGWAFDIGLQMMIHVLQSPLNVVVMVLVTDVYSNTGGQMSKATPKGMDAAFAPGGKQSHRFPLGLSVAYGNNAYVAQVNLAYPNHLIKSYKEAAAYKGPSLLLTYIPCMTEQKFPSNIVPEQARRAVTTRYWPLWSYDPHGQAWSIEGNPESHRVQAKHEGSFVDDFAKYEGRFRSQFDKQGNPSALLLSQQEENLRIWKLLQKNAGVQPKG
jgi:pyruvate-ferredoxin/flavodoxin oxidoreductase